MKKGEDIIAIVKSVLDKDDVIGLFAHGANVIVLLKWLRILL